MLTVTAVCVPPGYQMHHLDRLKEMVAAHLSQPFVWRPILKSDKPGWWAKIDLFRPGHFRGRVLYLDLDVTVTGSLDDLANHPAPFVAMKDPWADGINSSVMAWDAGVMSDVYGRFSPDIMQLVPGDQDWIETHAPSVETFPVDWCVSYKHNRRGVLPGVKPTYPDDMRVCAFHGSPKPWEVDDGPET